LLIRPGKATEPRQALLGRAAIAAADRLDVSSLHVTFLTEREWRALGALGFLLRTGQQFHWQNRGYATFNDFLADLSSRKRKMIRKERQEAVNGGIRIELVSGPGLTEAHWDAMFQFYMDTGSRKWGRPYLNRKFFYLLGAAVPERCLLIFAKRRGTYVAGALNLIGGDCLYGRYWGATEHHPCLHFEICYYQAIDYAIAHGLSRVEAGAQGEHKLARGYLPSLTYSAHWIANESFREAVARYLEVERREVSEAVEVLTGYGPFKKTCVEEQD
jgi:predicted N-acyltransferase